MFLSDAISSYTNHVSKAKNEIKIKLQINVNSTKDSLRKIYWTGHWRSSVNLRIDTNFLSCLQAFLAEWEHHIWVMPVPSDRFLLKITSLSKTKF